MNVTTTKTTTAPTKGLVMRQTQDAVGQSLDELRRRKRAIEATIESGARDCEALRGRIREIEARMERDGALAERYAQLIRDGEASLDRILESSEFLAETLARETRALFDDAEV